MTNPNQYGIHDEHREAQSWTIGNPAPAWVADPSILSLATATGGVTVAHYLAYSGYEFTGDLDYLDKAGRTVADYYAQGVRDREAAAQSETEAVRDPVAWSNPYARYELESAEVRDIEGNKAWISSYFHEGTSSVGIDISRNYEGAEVPLSSLINVLNGWGVLEDRNNG